MTPNIDKMLEISDKLNTIGVRVMAYDDDVMNADYRHVTDIVAELMASECAMSDTVSKNLRKTIERIHTRSIVIYGDDVIASVFSELDTAIYGEEH